MENLLNPIKTEINNWDQVRTTNIALNFLTSGNGFIIQKVDYYEWKKHHPTSIHCYFATEQLQLKFFLIDNVSDAHQNFKVDTNLLEKEFSRTITNNNGPTGKHLPFSPFKYTVNPKLNAEDAKNRIIDWNLSAELWFQSLINKEDTVPRLVIIPFADLHTFFSTSDDDVFVFFAIKNYQESEFSGYNIEFILTQIHPQGSEQNLFAQSSEEEFADVTRPSPPFDQDSNFNLLM